MTEELKLVIVSDSEQDADILLGNLSEVGFTPNARRVSTREELLDAVEGCQIDAFFLYGGLQWLDPPAAIMQIRESWPDVPLIFVSDPLGEDAAIEILKAGANDIVRKSNLEKVGVFLDRELKEAKARSEYRRIEKAIKTVANEWRTAVDTVRSPICLADTSGKILRCNKAFQRLSGKPFLEIVGVGLKAVLNAVDPSFDGETEKDASAPRGGRTHMLDLCGRTFEVQVEPVTDAVGKPTGYVHVMNDVTERLRAEEETRQARENLAKAQKMEAVGKLAGGIAHDFNNIITGIMGYCSVLLLRLPAESALRPFVSKIMSAAGNAATLTQGLLSFGRQQPFTPRFADLNSLVSGSKEFMSKVIGEEIEIRIEPCSQELPVFVDAVQIEQILLNLSTNARDAMSNSGVITVRTSRDGPAARPHAYIWFSDTGAGMEEGTLKRIFEPFFTTKEIGKGTGLGLSVVWSIVEQNGGRISVESAVGKGTTFTIGLPLMAGKSETADAVRQSVGGGTETILLVEDDDTVRDMARTVLEGFGYSVIPAADYDLAMKLFRENREKISLGIFDIVMPKHDGVRLFEEMHAQNPGLKRLFISGYADDVLFKKGVDGASHGFLRKPFPPLDLATRVREILDG
jgi:two-component system cell cycle sensor histidine kinase/response regulator CckA